MSTVTEIGKKHSFFEIISRDDYSIEIPIIQRDYAQGRSTASEIREHFLKTLYTHLEKSQPIDLDFVYGSIEDNTARTKKFIPLDGQQRLTTLFMIHWYLALKEGLLEDFSAAVLINGNSKFTYETRVSSRDFCNALVTNLISLPESKEEKISSVIIDSAWYYLSWDKDPTVQSMLTMLDDIHLYFFESDNFYKKLANLENPIITFQFIELKNFGLSDTLYIKMNARGKPLTNFENFKAKFEQILEANDKINGTKLKGNFSINMDTVWTDLFWPHRDKNFSFDKKVMNLFRLLFMNRYALRRDYKVKVLQELFDKKVDYNFYRFDQLNQFDSSSLENIMDQLNLLADETHAFKNYLGSKDVLDEGQLFEKVIGLNENVNITEALQFFALYNYIVYNEGSDGINDWMRIIRNLTENTIYNEVIEYESSIKALNELLPHSASILEFLSEGTNIIRSFFNSQLDEERIKARLILADEKWHHAITSIENHKYLNGQIGFLLKFSGITNSLPDGELKDWDGDGIYFESFIDHAAKFKLLFNSNGLRKFENFAFERALLSIGDYMHSKRKNWSFLINGFERDISWKRLLRDDSTQRSYLGLLMMQIADYNDIQTSLNAIIKQAQIEDWRKYFIEFPEIIANCGTNKFIRYENESDILLLEKLQTNGTHREYYSFALYLALKKRGETANYIAINGVEYAKYISSINRIKIDISYNFYKPEFYCIEYDKEPQKQIFFKTQDEVFDFLLSRNIIK